MTAFPKRTSKGQMARPALPLSRQRMQVRFAAVLCLLALLPSAPAATLLVWPDSPNPNPPYANWATAAQTIQAAVDAAQPGDTVLATNGVYASGGRAVYGLMTNRVVVDKQLVLQSVNGPDATIIKGYQVPGGWYGCGDRAVRCLYVTAGASVIGFTFTQGATRSAGDVTQEQTGGGVWCPGSAYLINCKLIGNALLF